MPALLLGPRQLVSCKLLVAFAFPKLQPPASVCSAVFAVKEPIFGSFASRIDHELTAEEATSRFAFVAPPTEGIAFVRLWCADAVAERFRSYD